MKHTDYYLWLGFVVGLLLIIPMNSHAASILKVRGTVTDGDGDAVDGLEVTVTNETKNLKKVEITNENGAYSAFFIDDFDSVADPGDRIQISTIVGSETATLTDEHFTGKNALIDIDLGVAPVIESITPNTGPITGGTEITITGKFFAFGATVSIRLKMADNVKVVSKTEIAATTPAGAEGDVDVVVTNPDGQSFTLTSGFTYLLPRQKTIFVSTRGNDTNDGKQETAAKRTIQAGIHAAADGDTVLVAGGIYTGEGNVNLNFTGKAITVKSTNGPENTIIDCEDQPETRGFTFTNGETDSAVLDGFTIKNGNISSHGGAISIDNASPTIKNCVISRNRTINQAPGGGISCQGSSSIITDCIIEGNQTEWVGGGIYCSFSKPIITNCVIRNNTARFNRNEEAGGEGGGISCYEAAPILRNCVITGNRAETGGGAMLSDAASSPTFINCTITKNTANWVGGGIYGASVTVKNTILWANRGELGGNEVHFGESTAITITFSDVEGGKEEFGGDETSIANLTYENNIDADPRFVDEVNENYDLSDQSPCIGAGISDVALDKDIDGESRGTPPDIGAFENPLNKPETETGTNVFVVIGIIANPDGRPAEAGLTVTVTVGDSPAQSAQTDADGSYNATFFNPINIVAQSGDTVIVSVFGIEMSGIETIVLTTEQITQQFVTVDVTLAGRPQFDLMVPEGIGLIHIPLKVAEVNDNPMELKTIGDLFDALGDDVLFLITYDPASTQWLSYLGDTSRGSAADQTLTVDMGLISVMNNGVTLRLKGDGLGTDGKSSINLSAGTNLTGVPLKDSRVNAVSDLLELDGIKDNATVIIVSDAGGFKVVARTGDDGDIDITGGQSFIITASQDSTTEITGVAWDNVSSGGIAAPRLETGAYPHVGHIVDAKTPVLAVHGSVVEEVAGLGVGRFRITVKNLSTGATLSALSGSDTGQPQAMPPAGGYSVTFVDTISGRSAQIGDMLEVSVETPSPRIGVQPLRYLVTPADVKGSQIRLPELIAYRVPTETELLLSYPNPFNPETWIPYQLAQAAEVRILIYNTMGQQVRQLEVGHRQAGIYTNRSQAAYWDGRNDIGERVTSGIYFYTFQVGTFTTTGKLILLK